MAKAPYCPMRARAYMCETHFICGLAFSLFGVCSDSEKYKCAKLEVANWFWKNHKSAVGI